MAFTKVSDLKTAFLAFLDEKKDDGIITTDAVEEMVAWFKENTKNEKKKRNKEPKDPNRVKKPIPASWLFRDQNRQQIIADHFEGGTAKGSLISQKAKELWDSMSAEERSPYEKETAEKWITYREANPSTTPSTPKKDFNFNPSEERTIPDAWEGPFEGKYLHKYANGYKVGVGRFETFEEAIAAAEKLENCGGITMNTGKRAGYTLRLSNDPVTPAVDDAMGPFVSWTKKDFVQVKVEKKKRTKKAATKEEPKEDPKEEPKEEPKEDGVNPYDEETEDEDEDEMPSLEPASTPQMNDDDSDSDSDSEDEDMEVVQWVFENTTYLVDEKTNQLFDFETQDPINKIRKQKKNGGGWKLKTKN